MDKRELRSKIEDIIENYVSSELTGVFNAAAEIADKLTNYSEWAPVSPGVFIIDVTGRIYMDGHHVGWMRREAGPTLLQVMARNMGASLPAVLDDFKKVEGVL